VAPVCPKPACVRRAGDHEALLAIEPKQPLMVHNEALPSQQHAEPPVAETMALWARALSRSRNSVSRGRREWYRTVIRTQPMILHARRSLNSNAERT
jgi:hypothetical protein